MIQMASECRGAWRWPPLGLASHVVSARFDGTVLGLDEPMLAYRQAGSGYYDNEEEGGGQCLMP